MLVLQSGKRVERSAAKVCFSLGENIHRSCCVRRVAIVGASGELMSGKMAIRRTVSVLAIGTGDFEVGRNGH